MARLSGMNDGSDCSSESSLSAAGQDEQPWLVNSSMTARGSTARGSAFADGSATKPTAVAIKLKSTRDVAISISRGHCAGSKYVAWPYHATHLAVSGPDSPLPVQ